MNKFEWKLAKTGGSVLEDRARLLAEDAKDEQEQLVKDLRKDIREIDKKIDRLNDVSVTSNDSLKPGEGFVAKEWVKEIQDLRVSRKILKEKLDIAEQTYKEFFETPVE